MIAPEILTRSVGLSQLGQHRESDNTGDADAVNPTVSEDGE